MKITYTLNNEHNGIEVKFSEKPEVAVLQKLKSMGFRWHNGKGIWFNRQSEEVIAYVKTLCTEEVKADEKPKAEPKKAEPKAENPKATATTKVIKAEPKKEEKSTAKTEKSNPIPTAEKKKDNIIEFPKKRPNIAIAITDGNATYEDCEKKLNEERKIFCDNDSQFVIDGILAMCKVSQNFRNNVMRKDRTYAKAFEYFVEMAKKGYALTYNGLTFMDNNIALGHALDYFNQSDEQPTDEDFDKVERAIEQ